MVHVFICSSFIHSAFTEHHIGIEHKAGDGPLPSWRLQSDGKCGWVNVHLQSGGCPLRGGACSLLLIITKGADV